MTLNILFIYIYILNVLEYELGQVINISLEWGKREKVQLGGTYHIFDI